MQWQMTEHFRGGVMLRSRLIVLMFLIGAMVPGARMAYCQSISAGSAQAFPNKSVRIVTAEAGGGNDLGARLIAQALTGNLGQQVIVDNRGGPVVIPVGIVTKAPPDGYTLLVHGSQLWMLPLLRSDTPYNPLTDLSSITTISEQPNILAVFPSLPVKSVADLIALAKSRPGSLNYSSGPSGASSHLAPELFKLMTGVNFVRIPYKGSGPALNALISGESQVMFPTAGTVTAHLKSDRLRALGVTSAKPSALFPGMPTIAASGVPGYESVSTMGMFAPLKTPPAIINRLNEEVARVINSADIKEKFFNNGLEALGKSPQEFTAYIKSDMTRMGKVIKDVGITAE
jgi:tripartite-type tricarboxylate transporter receptor subunit TctC